MPAIPMQKAYQKKVDEIEKTIANIRDLAVKGIQQILELDDMARNIYIIPAENLETLSPTVPADAELVHEIPTTPTQPKKGRGRKKIDLDQTPPDQTETDQTETDQSETESEAESDGPPGETPETESEAEERPNN